MTLHHRLPPITDVAGRPPVPFGVCPVTRGRHEWAKMSGSGWRGIPIEYWTCLACGVGDRESETERQAVRECVDDR